MGFVKFHFQSCLTLTLHGTVPVRAGLLASVSHVAHVHVCDFRMYCTRHALSFGASEQACMCVDIG